MKNAFSNITMIDGVAYDFKTVQKMTPLEEKRNDLYETIINGEVNALEAMLMDSYDDGEDMVLNTELTDLIWRIVDRLVP